MEEKWQEKGREDGQEEHAGNPLDIEDAHEDAHDGESGPPQEDKASQALAAAANLPFLPEHHGLGILEMGERGEGLMRIQRWAA